MYRVCSPCVFRAFSSSSSPPSPYSPSSVPPPSLPFPKGFDAIGVSAGFRRNRPLDIDFAAIRSTKKPSIVTAFFSKNSFPSATATFTAKSPFTHNQRLADSILINAGNSHSFQQNIEQNHEILSSIVPTFHSLLSLKYRPVFLSHGTESHRPVDGVKFQHSAQHCQEQWGSMNDHNTQWHSKEREGAEALWKNVSEAFRSDFSVGRTSSSAANGGGGMGGTDTMVTVNAKQYPTVTQSSSSNSKIFPFLFTLTSFIHFPSPLSSRVDPLIVTVVTDYPIPMSPAVSPLIKEIFIKAFEGLGEKTFPFGQSPNDSFVVLSNGAANPSISTMTANSQQTENPFPPIPSAMGKFLQKAAFQTFIMQNISIYTEEKKIFKFIGISAENCRAPEDAKNLTTHLMQNVPFNSITLPWGDNQNTQGGDTQYQHSYRNHLSSSLLSVIGQSQLRGKYPQITLSLSPLPVDFSLSAASEDPWGLNAEEKIHMKMEDEVGEGAYGEEEGEGRKKWREEEEKVNGVLRGRGIVIHVDMGGNEKKQFGYKDRKITVAVK